MQECRRYPTIVGKQQPNPLNLRDPRTTPKLLQTITAKTERIVEFESNVWFPSTSTNVPSPLKKGGRRKRKNSRLKGVQNRVQPPPIRRAHISPERREGGREEKNLRDKEGRAARKLPSWGGGAALCTNVNPSVSGGGQRASGGQPPSGLFAGIGRVVVHTKLFNGSLVTMGRWFTFIRPAAKSLVCIWSLATHPSTPYSGCARTKPAGERVGNIILECTPSNLRHRSFVVCILKIDLNRSIWWR